MGTKQLDSPWKALPESEHGMSNFDNTIDEGCEDDLKGGMFVQHSAWDFCAYVWFSDGQFHEEVWVYNSPRQVFSHADLRQLMDTVNNVYGWE